MSNAMDTLPLVNKLLGSRAFKYKVATKDWHPLDHISFASNHPEPNNKPFESFIQMRNVVANKPDETQELRLWPVHCVQSTKGAEFVSGLHTDKIDLIVKKGTDERVEMYSAFSDSFGNLTAGKGGVTHDLAKRLSEEGITDVYCVGVAGDYCVNYTALDSAKAGFKTYLIEEGQRCVDPQTWPNVKEALRKGRVQVISENSEQVQKLLTS